MASETEVIRQQMEGTRTAMAEKLEMLEAQVTDKVQQATSSVTQTVEAVSETVENVKETVAETVDAVKHSFDLQWHADRHPWMLLGGAVLLGFVGTRMLLPGERRRSSRHREREYVPQPPPPTPAKPASEPEHLSSGFLGQIGEGVGSLKQLGIGMAMGVIREVVAGAIPAVACPMSEALNSLTRKIGGQVLGTDQPDEPKKASDAAPEPTRADGAGI